jgi:hypothetical protein
MKTIRYILLNVFTWIFWKHFLAGLKSVLGHRTLAESIKEMKEIENAIRLGNNLKPDEKITWGNSKETSREIIMKYITLKHFNEVGELLAFFRAVDKKIILEEK